VKTPKCLPYTLLYLLEHFTLREEFVELEMLACSPYIQSRGSFSLETEDVSVPTYEVCYGPDTYNMVMTPHVDMSWCRGGYVERDYRAGGGGEREGIWMHIVHV